MAVDVSIILHGKPNDGSHRATPNIDEGIARNIVDRFFGDMSSRKDVAWLIADARCWQGQWYGVYTFWCGSNGVRDTSGRESFIALSVVIRGNYCVCVSAIYEHLKQVYESSIVGTYVQNGKYLVHNLDDPGAFAAVCQCVSTDFPEAMKPFDNTFQPQANMTDDMKYHVDDCDARAFVNDWKRCGRIIVNTTAMKKDSYRDEVTRLNNELEMSRKKHREQDEKLQKLNKENTSLQTKAREQNQSNGKLSKEVNDLCGQVESLQASLKGATDALKQIAGIVTQYSSVPPPPPSRPVTTSTESLWTKIKKFLDTFLLILILVVVGVFTYKAFLPDEAEQKGKDDIASLRAQVTTMNTTMNQLLERVGTTGGGEGTPGATAGTEHPSPPTGSSAKNGSMDEDCIISVTQAGKTISKTGGTVDFAQPISITISKQMPGYDIYTDNISNEPMVKKCIMNKTAVTINPKDKSKEVVISYSSANKSNANPVNIITLKQQ